MWCSVSSALVVLSITRCIFSLNIMLGNDDGFGSANLRETYRLLKDAGHSVLIVAPATFQSAQGGRSVYTTYGNLTGPTEYDLVPAGAPSLGTDPNDSMIWYYNGTPVACAIIGLDWVVPRYTNWSTVDLVVSGPNFGTNLGPFVYTLSGTNGYAYASVGKGYPSIAVSGGNLEQRSYQWINQTTPSGYADPATITAQLTVNLIQKLIRSTRHGSTLLPPGYGLSVNIPEITSLEDDSCIDPPFIQTRMTGGAEWDTVAYNATTNTFKYASYVPEGAGNTCINGYCNLPGETDVVHDGCQSSVTVFTVDYDAPKGYEQLDVRRKLFPLVEYFANGTIKGPHPGGYGHHPSKSRSEHGDTAV